MNGPKADGQTVDVGIGILTKRNTLLSSKSTGAYGRGVTHSSSIGTDSCGVTAGSVSTEADGCIARTGAVNVITF